MQNLDLNEHTYTYTHKYTHIHTQIYTYIINTQTHTNHTTQCIHQHTQHTQTIHTQTTHTHIHTSCIHKHTQTIYTHKHTHHIHTNVYILIHTHTHTHTPWNELGTITIWETSERQQEEWWGKKGKYGHIRTRYMMSVHKSTIVKLVICALKVLLITH